MLPGPDCRPMVLKLKHATKSHGGLVKTHISGPHPRLSESVDRSHPTLEPLTFLPNYSWRLQGCHTSADALTYEKQVPFSSLLTELTSFVAVKNTGSVRAFPVSPEGA